MKEWVRRRVSYSDPGSKTATLPIPIESDDQQDDQGTITVTLVAENQAPMTYTVAAAPNNEAMVMVFDDDGPPVFYLLKKIVEWLPRTPDRPSLC